MTCCLVVSSSAVSDGTRVANRRTRCLIQWKSIIENTLISQKIHLPSGSPYADVKEMLDRKITKVDMPVCGGKVKAREVQILMNLDGTRGS